MIEQSSVSFCFFFFSFSFQIHFDVSTQVGCTPRLVQKTQLVLLIWGESCVITYQSQGLGM